MSTYIFAVFKKQSSRYILSCRFLYPYRYFVSKVYVVLKWYMDIRLTDRLGENSFAKRMSCTGANVIKAVRGTTR